MIIVAVIVVAVLLFGIIGWKFVNGARTGPDGQDLSKPGIPPAGKGGSPNPSK